MEWDPSFKQDVTTQSSKLVNTAQAVATYAAVHIGDTYGTGYAAVHAPEIAGLITERCGESFLHWYARRSFVGKALSYLGTETVLNWYAKNTFAAEMMPFIGKGGGIVGGAAAGFGLMLAVKGVQYGIQALKAKPTPVAQIDDSSLPDLTDHTFTIVELEEATYENWI